MKDKALLIKSFFSIIARFIGVGLNFLLRIIITRSMDKPEAGMLFMLMTFVMGTSLFSRIGLEQWLVREVASAKENDNYFRRGALYQSYKLTILTSLLITIVWLLLSPWMRELFFHNEIDLDKLLWAGCALFFSSLVIINTFYLKAIKLTVTSLLVERALPAVSFLALIALTWQVFTENQNYIQLYTISIVAAGIISQLIVFPHIPKSCVQTTTALPSLKKLTQASLPLAPISFFSFIMLWADTLIVGLFLGNAEVALFNTAATVSFISLFFLGALDSTIYPRLLNIAKQTPERLKSFFWQATLLVIFTLLSVTALMALFSAPILSVFKEEYIAAQSSLMILLLAQFFRATSLTFSFMFIIREKVQYLNTILVISLIVNLVCNVFLIQEYGMEGAATATLIANGFLALAVIALFFQQRLLKQVNPT